jgi:hypothetical protein
MWEASVESIATDFASWRDSLYAEFVRTGSDITLGELDELDWVFRRMHARGLLPLTAAILTDAARIQGRQISEMQ